MQSGFIFGIIGSVLLLIGVFVPLVNLPYYGGISLFEIQQPVAIAMLVLGAAHLVFCINRVAWGLYVTKVGVLVAIALGIYRSWGRVADHGNFVTSILKPSANVHWGTGLLAAGILVLMAATIPHVVHRKTESETVAEEEQTKLPTVTEE
jgi:hypothetical protein